MNTAGLILIYFAALMVWLLIGFAIYAETSPSYERAEINWIDSIVILLGPLNLVIFPVIVLFSPFLEKVAHALDGMVKRRRIRREVKAVREISEAESAFDPTAYTPEQWKGKDANTNQRHRS